VLNKLLLVKGDYDVIQGLKKRFSAMSSSATTYFSSTTPGNSTTSGPLGYWSNDNLHIYQHYVYQNGGGIVHPQFSYQQPHSVTESGETLYQLHENDNARIHAPTEDQNATNTKYSSTLSPISYSVAGFNQQEIPRKLDSSPSLMQSSVEMSGECFPNKYHLSSSTSPLFANHYQQTTQGTGGPQPQARMMQMSRSPSPGGSQRDGTFPPIAQQPVVEVKKECTSPILGMLLNRPHANKASSSVLPSVVQSCGYHDFYSPTGLAVPTAAGFTNKDTNAEERDRLRHPYEVDNTTSTSSKTNDNEEQPSRQDFGNISSPQNQTEFLHNRFENRKLPLECLQPTIPCGGDGGERAKITSQIHHSSSFYPWMKSYAGELIHVHHSCGHRYVKSLFNLLLKDQVFSKNIVFWDVTSCLLLELKFRTNVTPPSSR
jgi:hypothetical protein